MNIFVLLYNSGTDKEGIHSIELKGRTIVLMFEDKEDATSAHAQLRLSRVGRTVRPRVLNGQKQKRSTGPSRVVPHRSTTPARTSLTSLFGWEAVSLVDMAALTATPQHLI